MAFQLFLTPAAPYAELARRVHLSVGEAHNAVKRLMQAKLVSRRTRRVIPAAFYELLTSGVPYVFPADLGPETRGVPTAYAAAPLAREIVSEDVVVWPSAKGSQRGQSLAPLYPGAPETAADNVELYHLLTLTDALRIGRARERNRAKVLLREVLLGRAAE